MLRKSRAAPFLWAAPMVAIVLTILIQSPVHAVTCQDVRSLTAEDRGLLGLIRYGFASHLRSRFRAEPSANRWALKDIKPAGTDGAGHFSPHIAGRWFAAVQHLWQFMDSNKTVSYGAADSHNGSLADHGVWTLTLLTHSSLVHQELSKIVVGTR